MAISALAIAGLVQSPLREYSTGLYRGAKKISTRANCCTKGWTRFMGVKKTGKGRRKLGRKKRRMRARIRHRKGWSSRSVSPAGVAAGFARL